MPTHTPTPWKTEFNPNQKGEPATLIMQAGAEVYERWIAECHWGKDGDTHCLDDGPLDCTADEAQANAALIVRSVNSHEALVALAEFCIVPDHPIGSDPEYLSKIRAKAEAALALALAPKEM